MRTLRKFDIFRVVQDAEKHLTPATTYGAAATMCTALLLTVLLIGEFRDYFTGHSQCVLAARAQPEGISSADMAKLRVIRALISFPYVPCHALEVEITMEEGRAAHLQKDMTVSYFVTPLGEVTQVRGPVHRAGTVEEASGCLVAVSAPMANGPASLNFILKDYDHNKHEETRLDHTIIQLEAGDSQFSNLHQFSQYITLASTSPLNWRALALRHRPQHPYFYQYYLQFVFTSAGGEHGFQYTQSHSVIGYSGRGRAPGLYFSYRPSGFSVECSVHYDTPSHFIVHLCAVVGGVYTVAGIVEMAIEHVARQRKKQERAAQNVKNTESEQPVRL